MAKFVLSLTVALHGAADLRAVYFYDALRILLAVYLVQSDAISF